VFDARAASLASALAAGSSAQLMADLHAAGPDGGERWLGASAVPLALLLQSLTLEGRAPVMAPAPRAAGGSVEVAVLRLAVTLEELPLPLPLRPRPEDSWASYSTRSTTKSGGARSAHGRRQLRSRQAAGTPLANAARATPSRGAPFSPPPPPPQTAPAGSGAVAPRAPGSLPRLQPIASQRVGGGGFEPAIVEAG
jgi:hypothetical protein